MIGDLFLLLIAWYIGSIFLIITNRVKQLLYGFTISFAFASIIYLITSLNMFQMLIGSVFDVIVLYYAISDMFLRKTLK